MKKVYGIKGYPIIVSDHMCGKFEIRKRSKKKRINNKLNKKYGLKKYCISSRGEAFFCDSKFVMDAYTFRKVKKLKDVEFMGYRA